MVDDSTPESDEVSPQAGGPDVSAKGPGVPAKEIGARADGVASQPDEPAAATPEPGAHAEEPTAPPEEPAAQAGEPGAHAEEPTAPPEEPAAQAGEAGAHAEEPAAPPEQPTPPPKEPAAELVFAAASGRGRTRAYASRFLMIYLGLAVVLVAAVTGAVVLALQPGPPKPPPWSPWRPAGGNAATMTAEIVNHVSHEYKLGPDGGQLVAVVPSSPEVHRYAKSYDVSTIGIRPSATSDDFSQVITTSGITQQEFCGLGEACSIATGKATQTRERLVRREALEIALYIFKYVPSINGVLAYMPPPPGQSPETVLFLERSNLQPELSQPLSDTLPLSTPPLPSSPDTLEANTIDRLTLPAEYAFGYEELSSKAQALILTPDS